MITFDKIVTGLSDRSIDIPGLEERMDDVRAVMDAAGSEGAALIGVSEGGPCRFFRGDKVIATSIFSVVAPHVAPLTNSLARSIVIGGLVVVLFAPYCYCSLERGIEVARGDGGVTGPNFRCMQSYAGVVREFVDAAGLFAKGDRTAQGQPSWSAQTMTLSS